MSIVNSTFSLDNHDQVDGRVYVTEIHTDSDGVQHIVEYLADQGMDHSAICTARATQINEILANAEANEILAG